MTLIVHNEASLLNAHLHYHYARGVDHVLAIDDRSTDGSADVLEAHAQSGRLTILERPPGEMFASQSRWATSLARYAKTHLDADWVINGDADEFWWPLHGNLSQALGRIPADYDVVLIPRTDFVLEGEPSGRGAPLHQMTVRERWSPIGLRVAHRGEAGIVVSAGHHRVVRDTHADRLTWTESGEEANPLRVAPLFPVRVFHYPVRAWEGMVDAARSRAKALARDPVLRIMTQGMDRREIQAMVLEAGMHPPARRQQLIEELLRRGTFVRDTRIRDFVETSTPPSNCGGAEELEVAGLVMYALSREDRKVRARARRLQQHLGDLRESRWWRLKDRLTPLPRRPS